jgi:hypothetical protein
LVESTSGSLSSPSLLRWARWLATTGEREVRVGCRRDVTGDIFSIPGVKGQ